MTEQYRAFEELVEKIEEGCINWADRFFDHDEARKLVDANLSAILGEFEALAGEIKFPCGVSHEDCKCNSCRLSALIQSVKERM